MRQHIKGAITARLPIPRDLHIGAVIGVGASHVKQIQRKHGVRCQVDAKKREAVVTGTRTAIDEAIDSLQDLFHRLRLERMQYVEAQRQRRSHQHGRAVEATPNRIYRIAHVTESSQDSWMFQRRPDVKEFEDPFENRLVRLESFGDDEDVGANDGGDEQRPRTWRWMEKFDAAFKRCMIQDVEQLTEQSADRPVVVKIKAALGLTTYALPGASTACRLYTWEQLRDLKLHEDVRRRWENTCNGRSEIVAALKRELEARILPDATYETALTAYVGFENPISRDMSVKFSWVNGQWTPVTQRSPIREPHGLYNIGLDDETAFRVRVYSREYPSNATLVADLWDQLELCEHPSGDPLRTEVALSKRGSHGMFIRSVWVRKKTQVDYQGLRFSISYSSADHTDAIIQAQIAPSVELGPLVTQPADILRELLDRMRTVLNRS